MSGSILCDKENHDFKPHREESTRTLQQQELRIYTAEANEGKSVEQILMSGDTHFAWL